MSNVILVQKFAHNTTLNQRITIYNIYDSLIQNKRQFIEHIMLIYLPEPPSPFATNRFFKLIIGISQQVQQK